MWKTDIRKGHLTFWNQLIALRTIVPKSNVFRRVLKGNKITDWRAVNFISCPLGRKQQAGSKDWWYWAATFLNYNHPETEKNVNNSPHYTESPITDGSVSLRSFAIPVLRELGERRAFIVGYAWLRRQGSGGEGHISGFAESHSDQSTSMEVGGGELKWMVRMLVEN